jgi:hypothetical protein
VKSAGFFERGPRDDCVPVDLTIQTYNIPEITQVLNHAAAPPSTTSQPCYSIMEFELAAPEQFLVPLIALFPYYVLNARRADAAGNSTGLCEESK